MGIEDNGPLFLFLGFFVLVALWRSKKKKFKDAAIGLGIGLGVLTLLALAFGG